LLFTIAQFDLIDLFKITHTPLLQIDAISLGEKNRDAYVVYLILIKLLLS